MLLFLATHHNDIMLIGINIKLHSGANDACSDDTARLKTAVAEWLNARKQHNCDPPGETQTPTMTRWLSSKEKNERGIGNNVTGGLLCPIDYDWDDLEYIQVICSSSLHDDGLIDPFSVRTKLQNAAPGFSFASNYFLRCLYLDKKGDPASPQVGFLKGPLLVRVRFCLCVHIVHLTITLFQAYQHIFTSPLSASGENSKSEPTARRRNMATMLRMDCHVTGRAIAYAATQVSQPLQIYSMSFANSFFQSSSMH